MVVTTRATVVVLLAACGSHGAHTGDAAVTAADGAPIDAAGCMPPTTPDAALASSAPACTANALPGSCLDVSTCYGSRVPTAGSCAGPSNIECCTPRYADSIACDPDTVPQPDACLTEEAGDPTCPAGMVLVDTFCVDRFEAALVEVVGSASQPWSPYFNPAGHTVRAVSLRGAVPQGYISQTEAAAACAAADKRLCTDTEWLRACQGPTMTTYPYGNTREPGVCNDARAVHPAIELYGTGSAWIYSHLDSPCLNQEAAGLEPTGAETGCVTAEGAFDMMGNLHEWTADPAGTFRGGYYVDTVENGNGCLYATTAHDVSYWDYSTGFRCCADSM
ncbi:MAG TPA: SUMF1/EgtB/PvdO family nonheme iron enzyme [Kofleriaceae bacterium]